MSAPGISGLTSIDSARRVTAALAAGGVRDVVVAPGSRSAPMAYALAEAEAAGVLALHVRIDERVAGFTALGLALGSGRPAVVLTTSGTAVGELMPAVMEANHASVPLVVLSADRPAELRGTGANQTTRQDGIYGTHVRCAFDIAAGEDPAPFIARALTESLGGVAAAGPVQLNLAFRDPLVPGDLPGPDSKPVSGGDPVQSDSAAEAEAVADRINDLELPSGAKTVVVAGHGAGEMAAVFAAHLHLPLLAEPSSNARFGPSAIAPYRLLLDQLGTRIEKVVIFGRPTLSRPIAALLSRRDIERALYLPEPVAWFDEGRRQERIISELDELLRFAGRGGDEWLSLWRRAGEAAEAGIQNLLAGESALNGLHVADAVWEHTDGNLVLGSSNPIRDVDLVAATDCHPLEVFANRGLAGIDGSISTATGVALASGVPTRLLVGDLTFLHDAGGLLLGDGEHQADLQVVVLNDSGGGIFGLLEHGAPETLERFGSAVERLFGTPHSADLGALARAYGVVHETVTTVVELDAAMARPIAGRSIIEVKADRSSLRSLHSRIRATVSAAVAGM